MSAVGQKLSPLPEIAISALFPAAESLCLTLEDFFSRKPLTLAR